MISVFFSLSIFIYTSALSKDSNCKIFLVFLGNGKIALEIGPNYILFVSANTTFFS